MFCKVEKVWKLSTTVWIVSMSNDDINHLSWLFCFQPIFRKFSRRKIIKISQFLSLYNSFMNHDLKPSTCCVIGVCLNGAFISWLHFNRRMFIFSYFLFNFLPLLIYFSIICVACIWIVLIKFTWYMLLLLHNSIFNQNWL